MRITALIILLILVGCQQATAQKQLKANKTVRKLQKINRVKDPENAIQEIQALRGQISTSNPKMRNFLIYLSIKESDLYIRTGDFQKAETILLETVQQVAQLDLNWMHAMLPFYEGTIYDCYERLAYFYLNTGNLKKAEQLLLESKAKREEVFPKHSVHRIHPIAGLGSLHYRQGNLNQTYALFEETEKKLSRATTTLYDYDIVSRIYLNDQAEICLLQGKLDEAWKYINKLAIASSGVAKFGSRIGSRLEIARIFELKARYFLLEENYHKAQEYLNQANDYYSTKISNSDIGFKLLKTQALIYWRQNNIAKANEAFIALISAYRKHIDANFISMSEYEKEQFFNILSSDFGLFNAYALMQSGTHLNLMEEMLNNTLNTKALLLNESNKIKNNILQGGDQELIQKLHRWEEAKAQLSSFYFDKDAIAEIDALEKEVESLENEINSKSQLFNEQRQEHNWKQVQGTLNSGEAAIEIIRVNTIGPEQKLFYGKNSGLSDSVVYIAFIIKSDVEAPQFVILNDGNRMENRYLSFYRNSIVARDADNSSYDIFWRPLKQQLSGTRRVYLSPDGVYNQLNLNTLRNPISKSFLIDEVELIYVTNTVDLLRQEESKSTTINAVLVGRPSYDLNTQSTDLQQTNLYGTRYVMTDELVSFREQEFADLPGTEQEITRIENTLQQRNIQVRSFLGNEALEENVKAVNSPSILHIATHGFFVDDAASAINPMIRSGLVLAGVKNKNQRENADGILTAYEATNLKLDQTKLVVLSACETGLGEVRNGQGVYGLQRAIIVAGAQNLLMSLWKVDDEATALLMTTFYQNWEVGKNQTAFRQAQMSLKEKYQDPFYWGAFIMLGK